MAGPLIVDIEKTYRGGPAVHASLTAGNEAQIVVLFGPSGSGKTTVLRCIAGLDAPDRGRIAFGEETWFDSERDIDVRVQQRNIGFLFQEYALFPHLSVEENIAFGLRGAASSKRARVRELASTFALREFDRRPDELSGGQRQRVALLRALAPEPRLLLLDEPLSALDAPARESLRVELRTMLKSLRIPTIVVTHDRIEALALGDVVAVLVDGSVHQAGPVAEVFSHPVDVAVARTVGVETVVPVTVERKEGGLLTLSAGTAQLIAVDDGHAGREAFACIRADEVLLERDDTGETSARNRLPSRVVAVASEGPVARVTLDCGFELAAIVTRRSCEEMSLRPGQTITAFVKASAIRVVARAPAE